jgi:uncharacterized SAM-binding protein YcdF (DUF218 family)
VHTAIVVPGHGTRSRDGAYRISGTCVALVREAERIAHDVRARAVVFSGWAPSGSPSEAEQMRALWRGPDVELVLEPTARVTAQNASRTVPLLVERGIRRAIVVVAPLHLYRSRFFFTRLYHASGIDTEFRVARAPRTMRGLLWELAAAAVCRHQLKAASGELARLGRHE